jgi:hypothetical protein
MLEVLKAGAPSARRGVEQPESRCRFRGDGGRAAGSG